MAKLKMFENFGNEDVIIFPWDEDAGYVDLNDPDEFYEYKDNIYFILKNSSEDVLNVVGFDNEKEWWELVNAINVSEDSETLQEYLIEVKDFLSNFNVEAINMILNKQ